MKHRIVSLVFFLLTVVALGLRLPQLGNRPFHGDEAVHAVKFRELWEQGRYAYDPNEFHGPTIYYAALPFVAVSGHRQFVDMQEADFRAAIAVVGAALVPLLLLLRKRLSAVALGWAGLFMALSPAQVFYSRYFIQEIFLVFFTVLFLACALRWHDGRKAGWLVGAGVAVGLMLATKETAVLSLAAAVGAWLFTQRRLPPVRAVVVGAGLAVLVAYVVLSGFFTNLTGPLGYFYTFTPWLRRAGGTELHNQPWSYYLQLLTWHRPKGGTLWSEGLIVAFSVLGGLLSVRPKWLPSGVELGFTRFLAVYTLLLTVGYAVIPYKTPWCALNFLTPMILLAGIGVAGVVGMLPGRVAKAVAIVLVLVGSAQLAKQSYLTSFVYFADIKNPYVYAQPVSDIDELKVRAEELAQVHPQKFDMVIKVISKDEYYWPLPWTLRRFKNIGYYTQIPADAEAPLVFASPEFDEALTKRLEKTHQMPGLFALRPGVFFEHFVRMDLWEQFIKRRGPVED